MRLAKSRLQKIMLLLVIPFILVAAGTTYWFDNVFASNKPDYWPDQEWKTAAPEMEGVDSIGLAAMIDQMRGQNVHSFVIVRNGYIIAEGYNADTEAATKQDIYSATKSVTSALVGIAIDNKQIGGVEEKINRFFPELANDADIRKQQITVGNLLNMTAGFNWSNVKEASSIAMMNSADWIQYILRLPMAVNPGFQFDYSNGNAHLLSGILQKTTNKTEAAYAKENLFDRIGIRDVEWGSDPQGYSNGAFGLNMTARDMAKFGFLYLNDGKWNGQTILSSQWVHESTQEHFSYIENSPDHPKRSYGYFWWLRDYKDVPKSKPGNFDMYSAIGSGGQRIIMIPKENVVAVFTANNPDTFFADPIIDSGLMTAIKSKKPLRANPQGVAQLEEKIKDFKQVSDSKEAG